MADKDVMAEAASKMIRSYEVAGGNDSDAALKAGYQTYGNEPSIPDSGTPGNAGLTLGFGHDLGQSTQQEVDDVYGPNGPKGEIFSAQERTTLKQFAGKKVYTAQEKAAALTATKNIKMTYDQATEVFEKGLLVKKGIDPARKAYPGFDDLPVLTQAAIVDRTYMRGPGPWAGAKGKQLWTELHDAIMKHQTYRVYATLVKMEALHKTDSRESSTQGRARKEADLAYKGYMSTQETGEVPPSPIG